jgi:hypothetical protein
MLRSGFTAARYLCGREREMEREREREREREKELIFETQHQRGCFHTA